MKGVADVNLVGLIVREVKIAGGFMPRKKATTPDQVYQLKITLWGSKPQVWRRVLVPEQFTLHQLH